MDIRGVLPPIITPFKENGDVDYDAFGGNIERWNNEPLAGYLVLGSNSETPYLNEEEKLRLIELTVQAAKKEKMILAGTGLESTRETIRFTSKAARRGAHAALILTPFYYGDQMDDRALIEYFASIADASEIPILIYNVPKFTHLNISVEAVQALSQHPNIVGMKDSLGSLDQLKAFQKVVPERFNLIVGSGAVWYDALQLGIRAAILAVANCLPAACVEVQRWFTLNRREEAESLQARLRPVNTLVTETFGVPGLKYACTLTGYIGGFPRSPLQPLPEESRAKVRQALVDGGFFQ